jgi:hypothetical protein
MAVRESTRSRVKKPRRGNEIRTHPFDVLELLLKAGRKGGRKRVSPKKDLALNLARLELLGLACSTVWCARAFKASSSEGRFLTRTLMNIGRGLCEVVTYLGEIGAARKIRGFPPIRTKKGFERCWKEVLAAVDGEFPKPSKRESRAKPSGGAS